MALRCSASLWLLLVASCVLTVCSGVIVDNQTFSDAPNQQTLPKKPFLGLTITNPEGMPGRGRSCIESSAKTCMSPTCAKGLGC